MKVGLFPGQGIPAATVLAALPAGHELVERASTALCYDLHRKVAAVARKHRSGLPTSLAQPAIFTASLVAFEAAADEPCDFLLGHSLGEYAALVAGGAISFEHGLSVVQVRGRAMEAAAATSAGGMAAVIGVDLVAASEIAERCGLSVANDNDPSQVVLSGSEDALARAATMAKQHHGARSVRLDVQAPFHTDAMSPARDALINALDHCWVTMPKVSVISNVSSRPYRAPGEIRRLLVDQMVQRVRFRECLEYVWSAGGRDWIDFGPGRVVGGLAQRTFAHLEKEIAVGA